MRNNGPQMVGWIEVSYDFPGPKPGTEKWFRRHAELAKTAKNEHDFVYLECDTSGKIRGGYTARMGDDNTLCFEEVQVFQHKQGKRSKGLVYDEASGQQRAGESLEEVLDELTKVPDGVHQSVAVKHH